MDPITVAQICIRSLRLPLSLFSKMPYSVGRSITSQRKSLHRSKGTMFSFGNLFCKASVRSMSTSWNALKKKIRKGVRSTHIGHRSA